MALTSIVLFCAISLFCGFEAEGLNLSRSLHGNRIVGGSDADISEIPYQVSIRLYKRHICGGVILNKNFILTAAHCFMHVSGTSRNDVTVRVGSSHSNKGGLIYNVHNPILHPDYPLSHQVTTDYDVALLKLDYPLKFDKNIQPVKLAEPDYEVEEGTKAIVSGWGRLGYEGEMPINLQKVEVEIMDSFDCYLVYADLHEVTERQICAGSPRGGKDACSGDSGGPLTIDGVVVGLVSWGDECGDEGYPGVYSNIAQYREWIDATLKLGEK